MSTDKKTSVLIDSLLPSFLQDEGPQFQTFVKAYYEWMEQSGQMTEVSKNLLNYQDLDETADEYLKYFKREILSQFPENIIADKRLVYKKIKDLYRAKGTEQSYRLLFRLLYDEDIEIYYPGQDILRASDGRWVQETSIRLTKPFTGNPETLAGTITGRSSQATARVERVQRITSGGVEVYEVFVADITGTFLDGEEVDNTEGTFSGTILSKQGGLQRVIVTEGGSGFQKNDVVSIASASGSGGRGTVNVTNDGSLISLSVSNTGSNFERSDPVTITNLTRAGFVDNGVTVQIIDGGYGYRVNTALTFTGGTGSGAVLTVGSISNPSTITIGANTYTYGTINSISVISQGDGYTVPPTVSVRDEVIAVLNLNNIDLTIVDGGSGYTTNSVITITGGNGQGASAEVASVSNTEVVQVYTDFISGLADTPLNSVPFGSANTGTISASLAAANINSTLLSALEYANNTVGTIASLNVISSGNNYTSNPSVSALEQTVSLMDIEDGSGGYKGRNAVITADIGNGFIGNTGDAVIIASRATANATGAPLITAPVEYTGRYNDVKGFLSWSNKLQDNFFYQEYSYVIKSEKTLNAYREIVNSVVHPSGTKLFGEFRFDITIDGIEGLSPTIARETVLYIGSAFANTFIPSVVSSDIEQYVRSEDLGAISDYPELEIELIESMPADVTVDISNAGYQLEIELIGAQTSALLAADEIVSVYLQRLITNVSINSRSANIANLLIGEIWDPLVPSSNNQASLANGSVWIANSGLYVTPELISDETINYEIAVGLATISGDLDIFPVQTVESANSTIMSYSDLPIYALNDSVQDGWPLKDYVEASRVNIGTYAANTLNNQVTEYESDYPGVSTGWTIAFAPIEYNYTPSTTFGNISDLDMEFSAFSQLAGPLSEFTITQFANTILLPIYQDMPVGEEITIPNLMKIDGASVEYNINPPSFNVTTVQPTDIQIDMFFDSLSVEGDEVGFYNSRNLIEETISEYQSYQINTFANTGIQNWYSPEFSSPWITDYFVSNDAQLNRSFSLETPAEDLALGSYDPIVIDVLANTLIGNTQPTTIITSTYISSNTLVAHV